MPSKTPRAKASSCALVAQNLKLYDCLVKVTDFDSTKSSIFWLSGYLRKPTGLQKDGTIDCVELSYPRFIRDLETHFDFDPDTHELQWHDNMSGSQLKLEASSNSDDGSQSIEPWIVETHNSWVAALMIMQATNSSSNLQASSVSEVSSATTAGSSVLGDAATAAPVFVICKKDSNYSDTESEVSDTTTDSSGTSDVATDENEASDTTEKQ
ncbi:hypothetical protein N7452_000492 [Penicillium brevicompactum]|uniref:Uncharacterized protein n=1 Tax=Penicillium brevicompactum TaxID=5074 RepID=A0A9W9UNC9_PENBR|nr:hypothetical protein N7452_000492 [Penicillium brevicompactum]